MIHCTKMILNKLDMDVEYKEKKHEELFTNNSVMIDREAELADRFSRRCKEFSSIEKGISDQKAQSEVISENQKMLKDRLQKLKSEQKHLMAVNSDMANELENHIKCDENIASKLEKRNEEFVSSQMKP